MELLEPRKPRGLIEAEVVTKKIKLNFGRISKETVQSIAHESVTPGGGGIPMPDPVERIGRRREPEPPVLPGIM